jgi:hypothetical protein
MRTLYEIIESAKSGEMPTHDECYWSVLALDALGTFDRMSFHRLVEGKIPAMVEYEESFNRIKRALNVSPKDWVGPNNDPSNVDYQKRRRVSMKIYQMAMDGKLPNQKKDG